MLQAVSALSYLAALQLLHGGVNLPHIKLVSHEREPLRIKLTDFGLACSVAALSLSDSPTEVGTGHKFDL